MRLKRRFASTLLGSAAALAAVAQPIDRAALIEVAPSVLKIEALTPEGRFQLGSGVIVSAGQVVTNCHVTRHAARVHVVKGGVRWTATLQSADLQHDLCLLRVPQLEGEPVRIARASALRVGQSLMAMGYTGGVGMQLSEGEVVALHRYDGSEIVQSSNWFNSGASGGGLFDASGALVGILTFRLRGGAAHYFAAPADWLLARLPIERDFVSVAPLQGKTFWEESSDAQPFFLQAATLEQNEQWQALAQLAERWSREAQDDPEAAYLLGLAYDGLKRHHASIAALQRCLEIDSNYVRAWVRLATVYKRQGQQQDMRHALTRLASLDPKQANELSIELERQ